MFGKKITSARDLSPEEVDGWTANALKRTDRELASATGADKARLEEQADVLAGWFSEDVR